MRIRHAVVLLAAVAAATGIVAPAVASAATSSQAKVVSVPVGSRELYLGNYDTGNFCQWGSVQNKVRNGSACGYDQKSFYGMQIRNDGPSHPTAARFEIRDGDIPSFGGGERAEVRAGDVANVVEGDERWYQFSLRFGETFPNPTGGFFVLMQWYGGDGSPALAIEVNQSGVLQLRNNRGEAPSRDIGPIKRGGWVDYVVHVTFSNTPSVGFAEVYQNKVLVVPKHFRKTMSSPSSYLKMGAYRDAVEQATAIVWQDGLRVTAP